MPYRAGTTAQRIRIGLTGLAFAFILVLLGSAISRSGRDSRPLSPAEQQAEAQAEADEPTEPLAKLGVAPGSTPSEGPGNNSSSVAE